MAAASAAAGGRGAGAPGKRECMEGKLALFGDTIVFEYNAQFHNVLQVRKTAYDSCSAAQPMATYTSGNDSIALKTAGHHYFLCGVPTHCAVGQRVDVNALASSASAPAASSPGSSSVPSPTTAPSAASGPGSVPLPEKSGASPVASCDCVVEVALLVAVALPWFLL